MKTALKQLVKPFREMAGRFIVHPLLNNTSLSPESIFSKAAWMIAGNRIEGDFLEFGVFKGASFIQAFQTLNKVFDLMTGREDYLLKDGHLSPQDCQEMQRIWDALRLFAFDSFQGLPSMSGIDLESKLFKEGKYSSSQGEFTRNIQRSGVPLEKVQIIPGWFNLTCTPEARNKLKLTRASIIHIDCDLYESTRDVLEFVTPLLQDGTVIIFDDWFHYNGNPSFGEQRAFNEWRSSLPDFAFTEYQKEGAFRNSFIANRRS